MKCTFLEASKTQEVHSRMHFIKCDTKVLVSGSIIKQTWHRWHIESHPFDHNTFVDLGDMCIEQQYLDIAIPCGKHPIQGSR